MVAPPLHLHLRLKGVPILLSPPPLPSQNEAPNLSVAGSQSGGQQSELPSEAQESEQDLLDGTTGQSRRVSQISRVQTYYSIHTVYMYDFLRRSKSLIFLSVRICSFACCSITANPL